MSPLCHLPLTTLGCVDVASTPVRLGHLAALSPASTGGLTLGVTAAVLGAAVLHAAWNAAAHRITDRLAGFAVMEAACAVVAAVVLPFVPWPVAAAWPYIVASAAVHVGYNLALMRSYRIGEFSQMYPLARGTSPWVVALVAAVGLGETLGVAQLAGVLVVSLGLVTLVLAGGRLRRGDLPAVSAALLTGLTIATYTLLDGVGVRLSHATFGYVAWLFLLQGLAMPLSAYAVRGRSLVRDCRPVLGIGAVCGLASLVAYGTVIWAQDRAALASVAALRETSIIVGAVIGAVWFHEGFGRWRVVGAVLAVTGILLLNV